MLGRAIVSHHAREAATHDSGTEEDVVLEAPLFFILPHPTKKYQSNDSDIGEDVESQEFPTSLPAPASLPMVTKGESGGGGTKGQTRTSDGSETEIESNNA